VFTIVVLQQQWQWVRQQEQLLGEVGVFGIVLGGQFIIFVAPFRIYSQSHNFAAG
jgi:hypothetical protein